MAKESAKEWAKIKPEEIEKKIVELGKQNVAPEKIGIVLRDQHGIPKSKMFGKKITKVLKQNNIQYETEEEKINKKVTTLKKHYEKNKHDYYAQRSIVKSIARINKLKK